LRREEIKLQVALITPLMHVKEYAAPETKTAEERALLLIEQAEERGESPEDPLLLFSVLYGFWVVDYVAFNGTMMRNLAEQVLIIAEKQAVWRDVERRAVLYGIRWSAVPPYPIKHLSLVNRIALSATVEGWCADYVKTAYQCWFITGQDPSVEPSMSDNLRAIGQDRTK
jgi:hypothetical protein